MKRTNILNNIKTIDELKPYACTMAIAKKDWSLTCVDCKNKDTCACGSRVNDILEKQTRAKTYAKQTKSCAKATAALVEKTRNKIRQAFALDVEDPIQWVLDHGSCRSRVSACTIIGQWIKHYPDLVQELNMKERYDACKRAPTGACKTNVEAARLRVRLAFGPDVKDPIEWVLNNTGVKDREIACITIRKWIKLYPDLVKDLNMEERYNACKRNGSKKPIDIPKEEPKTEEDEVSVEDFLAEVEEQPKVETNSEYEIKASPASMSIADEYFIDSLRKKRADLIDEYKGYVQDINRIKALMTECADDINSIERTARIFGIYLEDDNGLEES